MSIIARVAESCFWLGRYLERVESTARILAVNRSLVMTAKLPPQTRWRPMVIVVGEEPGFIARHGEEALEDGERVQDDLTWSKACPVSIWTSLRWARENVRTTRDTLSQELWHSVNAAWLWLNSIDARALYDDHRHAFYGRVLHHCQHVLGVCYGTLPRQQPYDFLRLGLYLERSGQTARLLDVHQHRLADPVAVGVEANIFWSAVLRSCSGYDMFLKTSRRSRLSGGDVFRFLVADPHFPRAIRYGLARSRQLLDGLRPDDRPQLGARCSALSDDLEAYVAALADDAAALDAAHAHLTWIVDHTAQLCDAVSGTYFHLQSVGITPSTSAAEPPSV